MKEFLKTFLLFAILGVLLIFSLVISVVIGDYIISFLSLDLNEWRKTVFYIIWLCFSLPLTAAVLDKILDYFLDKC